VRHLFLTQVNFARISEDIEVVIILLVACIANNFIWPVNGYIPSSSSSTKFLDETSSMKCLKIWQNFTASQISLTLDIIRRITSSLINSVDGNMFKDCNAADIPGTACFNLSMILEWSWGKQLHNFVNFFSSISTTNNKTKSACKCEILTNVQWHHLLYQNLAITVQIKGN